MSRVLILQHHDRVPPARLLEFLQSRSIAYHIVHLDKAGVSLPPIDEEWRAIVSLGGPQASYEDEQYPYLKAEKSFLKHHIEHGTPLLGICLGAQIIADCIGGKTSRASAFECGFVPINVTADGMNDPLITQLIAADETQNDTNQPTLSQSFVSHHGDTFTLPISCAPLLRTAFTQAFRYKSAFAVQFHPEATAAEMSMWVSGDSDEKLAAIGWKRNDLLLEVQRRSAAATKSSEEFFDAWWTHINITTSQQPTLNVS